MSPSTDSLSPEWRFYCAQSQEADNRNLDCFGHAREEQLNETLIAIGNGRSLIQEDYSGPQCRDQNPPILRSTPATFALICLPRMIFPSRIPFTSAEGMRDGKIMPALSHRRSPLAIHPLGRSVLQRLVGTFSIVKLKVFHQATLQL